LLRYLGTAGVLAPGLERTVPRVQRWRLSTIPRHLPWEQVQQLIDAVDVTRPAGMRDRAILLLMATLGLRGGEVIRLELKHIDWLAGEVRLPRTKSLRERVLPIPHDLGAALADYVLYSRPALDVPQVFLRDRAPMGPLRSAGAVGAIVAQHLGAAGLAKSRAAHLLRHSLATRMVNSGVPIKTIADVLGHACIDTTAIYTKVDLTRLRTAALPFATGGAK
jgi:site-specific recombinase XerD